MMKLPFNVKEANEELIIKLINIGVLYTDENGLHASEPGDYAIKPFDKSKSNK